MTEGEGDIVFEAMDDAVIVCALTLNVTIEECEAEYCEDTLVDPLANGDCESLTDGRGDTESPYDIEYDGVADDVILVRAEFDVDADDVTVKVARGVKLERKVIFEEREDRVVTEREGKFEAVTLGDCEIDGEPLGLTVSEIYVVRVITRTVGVAAEREGERAEDGLDVSVVRAFVGDTETVSVVIADNEKVADVVAHKVERALIDARADVDEHREATEEGDKDIVCEGEGVMDRDALVDKEALLDFDSTKDVEGDAEIEKSADHETEGDDDNEGIEEFVIAGDVVRTLDLERTGVRLVVLVTESTAVTVGETLDDMDVVIVLVSVVVGVFVITLLIVPILAVGESEICPLAVGVKVATELLALADAVIILDNVIVTSGDVVGFEEIVVDVVSDWIALIVITLGDGVYVFTALSVENADSVFDTLARGLFETCGLAVGLSDIAEDELDDADGVTVTVSRDVEDTDFNDEDVGEVEVDFVKPAVRETDGLADDVRERIGEGVIVELALAHRVIAGVPRDERLFIVDDDGVIVCVSEVV